MCSFLCMCLLISMFELIVILSVSVMVVIFGSVSVVCISDSMVMSSSRFIDRLIIDIMLNSM